MSKREKVIIRRLPHGGDLLDELTGLARREGVRTGTVSAIGAVSRARIGFYDQAARVYRDLDLDQPLEICSCLGNISLKDGEVFVHAHVVLADDAGETRGGHLCPGTVIFAAECRIDEIRSRQLERGYDDRTGLSLWPPEGPDE